MYFFCRFTSISLEIFSKVFIRNTQKKKALKLNHFNIKCHFSHQKSICFEKSLFQTNYSKIESWKMCLTQVKNRARPSSIK